MVEMSWFRLMGGDTPAGSEPVAQIVAWLRADDRWNGYMPASRREIADAIERGDWKP